jgi:hypothetical protein
MIDAALVTKDRNLIEKNQLSSSVTVESKAYFRKQAKIEGRLRFES